MKKTILLLTGLTVTLFCCVARAQTPVDTLAQTISGAVLSYQTIEIEPLALDAPAQHPYKAILTQRNTSFSFGSMARGLLGICAVLFIAWIFSLDRKRIHWPTVGKALLIQFLIAVGVLWVPAIQTVFEVLGKCFVVVLDWTKAGSVFLFGNLMDPSKFGFVFA